MNLLIAFDWPSDDFVGWYDLVNLCQNALEISIKLISPTNLAEQRRAVEGVDAPDIILANAFEMRTLMAAGYRPFLRLAESFDEMVIVAPKGTLTHPTQVKKGMKVALTHRQDLQLVGLRLLEVANIDEKDLTFLWFDNQQGVAQALLMQEADIGFFSHRTYKAFSSAKKAALSVLIRSKMQELYHVFLAKRGFDTADLTRYLIALKGAPDAQKVLDALGIAGFCVLSKDEVYLLLDVLETLRHD